MIMSTAKKWTAYIAYILAVAALFLYMLFPSDTVKTYLGHRLAQISSDVSFTIEALSPSVPPGVAVENVDVTFQGNPAVTLNQLTVKPAYLRLLRTQPAVNFHGLLADGEINGQAALQSESETRSVESDMTFEGIDLSQIPLLKTVSPYTIAGKAGGTVHHRTTSGPWGTGSANVEVTECRVTLKQPIMGIGELELDRIAAEAEMNNRQVKVAQLRFEGPSVSGNGKGTLQMRQPIENSRINLTGTVKPRPQLLQSIGGLFPKRYLDEGGIPVRITGTLKRPNVGLR